MATIVTNVKERLRSRSRRRSSIRGKSIDETRPPLPSVAISGWQQRDGDDQPRTLRHTALGEPSLDDGMVTHSPTDKELPEVPQGRGLGFDPSMLAQSLGNTYITDDSARAQMPSTQQSVPDRYSSMRNKNGPPAPDGPSQGHRRTISQPMVSNPISRKPIPPRHTSKQDSTTPKRRHIPIVSTSPELGQYEAEQDAIRESYSRSSGESSSFHSTHSSPSGAAQVNGKPRFPARKDSLDHSESSRGRVSGHRTGRSLDLAPNDPSHMSSYDDKEHEMLATAGTRGAMEIPDDVQIPPRSPKRSPKKSTIRVVDVPDNIHPPEEYQLESYRRTDVSTDWMPAVTQEVVHHQRTEIIHREIYRDVHVHHYYEYFQPLKVVEVLPARHWYLDPTTGRKIEIPEPNGWNLPATMRAHRPDTSTITKRTRHYLVDDEHPTGILEGPSGTYEEVRNKRLSTTSATAAAAA